MTSPGMTWTERAAVPNSPVVESTALSCVHKTQGVTEQAGSGPRSRSGHLEREGFRLHRPLQDDETVQGHVDVATVLDLVLHIWVHALKKTHRER